MMHVIPLGGCGEFGRNATAIVEGDSALLIDCGLQFPDDRAPGVSYFVQDFRPYLERYPLSALVLTHAHEDHIGGVGRLLLQLDRPLPIYGRAFTLRLLRDSLLDDEVPKRLWDLIEVESGEPLAVGSLSLRLLRVPHSIPEACAALVQGAQGEVVLHSGDLKLDGGGFADFPKGQRVDLLLLDSTNATVSGRAGTETDVEAAFLGLLKETRGRLAVALFSSHMERVERFARCLVGTGRKLLVLGRGLTRVLSAAEAVGIVRLPATLLCSEAEAQALPPEQLSILCTGCQGEEHSGLSRLSQGSLLQAGDTVVIAARTIPGSERQVARIVDRFCRMGIQVVPGGSYAASGHACAEELADLIHLVSPAAVMPIHGGARQQRALCAISQKLAVPALFCQDGDVVQVVAGAPSEIVGRIAAPPVAIEGQRAYEVSEETFHLRRRLQYGVVLVSVLVHEGRAHKISVSAKGVLDEGPVYDSLCDQAQQRALLATRHLVLEEALLTDTVTKVVRRVFAEHKGHKPLVVVHSLNTGR